MPVMEIDETTPHDFKLSIQYDAKIEIDDRPAYNLHTGLLPEWGGCDILYHTLKEHASTQGLTFHRMTEKFDQGPIISRIDYPVFETDDMVALYKRMAAVAPGFLVAAMRLLDTLGEQAEQCEALKPRLYMRGKIDEADAALYAQTPARLREAMA